MSTFFIPHQIIFDFINDIFDKGGNLNRIPDLCVILRADSSIFQMKNLDLAVVNDLSFFPLKSQSGSHQNDFITGFIYGTELKSAGVLLALLSHTLVFNMILVIDLHLYQSLICIGPRYRIFQHIPLLIVRHCGRN